MDAGSVTFLVFLFLVGFLASGTAIFVAIICTCAVSLTLFLGFDVQRLGATLARILIRSSSAWELSAIPLFIWMGEIVHRTSLVAGLFKGLAHLVRRLPGGLLHTNVIGSAMFAAVCGSSTATTATVGKIFLGELGKRGYDRSISIGSLAGSGTLGLLIPPSIIMIIYGLLAQVSIIQLFAAGILPGLLIAGLYSLYIALRTGRGSAPPPQDTEDDPISTARALLYLMPVVSLMLLVLGSIYSGYATPSESATIGVAGALLLTLLRGELTWRLLLETVQGAVPMSCTIIMLMAAAAFLSTTMGFLHIPQDVASIIGGLNLGPYALLLVLSVFYLVLGLLLDGISITVMTLPITLPLIVANGIDPLWFGIFLIVMVELAQVTPPVGFNLFVIQGISGETVLQIARHAFPFFLLMCLAAVLLAIFPQIVLWLPHALYK
ncbi:TRAP transporter large permease [Seohaeicola zhoushanensis]|uniref:TRAP transporter large permease protein n=1 Tax=Seohaeicola zhoushanensis TaxID=1569283 RepID=A0A8J3GWQ6_9RHOB|nr:TRAP transporter large permease subunit [Seohaeicola zhoushanensis]GHF49790.1 C4-dicarboxylate ABC transporter permease [Seohaeicola zhoushanensis]